MGEIAEMMLEGTLCQDCGGAVEHSAGDFPQSCEDCFLKARKKKDKKKEDRGEFAMKKLKEEGFEPILRCRANWHIQIGDWNFWAWTGKMYKAGGSKIEDRGLSNFIKELKKDLTLH